MKFPQRGVRPYLATAMVLAATILASAATMPAAANHFERIIGPEEPTRNFPDAFMALLPDDRQQEIAERPKWSDPRIGGWGGVWGPACKPGKVRQRPVIFVHGNSEDASFWNAPPSGTTIVNVRDAFVQAGYCEDEIWAISYTGRKGYFTYNDINTAELEAFVSAVLDYTKAREVDIVAHSLGVTVVRKAAFNSPSFYRRMASFVAIAGANHGTTTCRGAGEAKVSHVCEEVHPGSEWLQTLNAAGETPPGPRYLTIYDGSGVADQFYLGPDAESPRLKGACNFAMPGTAHNTLARGETAVKTYLAFLRDGKEPTCT